MRNITELLQSKALKVVLSHEVVYCDLIVICIVQDKKEKSREAMKALLSQEAYRSIMCNVVSILNPKLR